MLVSPLAPDTISGLVCGPDEPGGAEKAVGWEDGDDDDDEGFHLFATMLTTQALEEWPTPCLEARQTGRQPERPPRRCCRGGLAVKAGGRQAGRQAGNRVAAAALAANCGQAHLLTRGASSRGCCRGRGASPAAKRAGKAAAAVSAALPAFGTQ